jgi:hypothetical protein
MNNELDKLIELHDIIKMHPYRLQFEKAYMNNYQKALYELSDTWYKVMKNHPKFKDSNWMLHDFNGSIMGLNHSHIERCLGIIHRFIDTGEVPVFYTHYTGCNILKSMNRLRKYVYNAESNKYIPQYSKEEVENSINEIKEYYKGSDKKIHEFGMYSQHWIDFLTDYKQKYYSTI